MSDLVLWTNLRRAMHDAVHGRPCWRPGPDGATVDAVEYYGLAELAVFDILALEGERLRVLALDGDQESEEGATLVVEHDGRRFVIQVYEHGPTSDLSDGASVAIVRVAGGNA